MEADYSGGQSSPWAVAPRGRKELDDWIYWRFFTIAINYDSSHSMNIYHLLHSLLDHERLIFHCDESLLTHWTPLRVESGRILCYDRQSFGQPVLEWSTHLGLTNRFLLKPDSCRFLDLGRSLSDDRTGLSFTIYGGPRQRSHSRVRVLWDSWP
jgi:hypothetical protein